MTKRECAIVTAYTGFSMLKGNDLGHLYRYLSGFIGRPIYSHEIPAVAANYHERICEDFLALCRNATDTEVDADG